MSSLPRIIVVVVASASSIIGKELATNLNVPGLAHTLTLRSLQSDRVQHRWKVHFLGGIFRVEFWGVCSTSSSSSSSCVDISEGELRVGENRHWCIQRNQSHRISRKTKADKTTRRKNSFLFLFFFHSRIQAEPRRASRHQEDEKWGGRTFKTGFLMKEVWFKCKDISVYLFNLLI